MKVSIVVPCYNMGAYVGDAVESVYQQSYTDFELIIVDDGSTDGTTHEVLKKIQDAYPDTKILYKKNSGLAGARNYGIERAKGAYITCLDADDKLAPRFLEKTVAVFEEDKARKVGFVTTWLQEFGERSNLWKTGDFDIPKLLTGNIVHAGSLFRKQVWEKVGGYKKMKIGGYEDWNFWLSIVENDYIWRVVEEPLFYYRIRENSMLAGASTAHVDIYKMLYELHQEFFEKHVKEIILTSAEEAKALHQAIKEKNKIIDEYVPYRDEVMTLRQQVFQLRDEVHSLRNSRVLGRIIKARDSIGESRKKVKELPGKSVHQLRMIVAPMVPERARKAAKRAYHKGKATAFNAKPARIEFIQNQPWESSLPLVSVVIPYYNLGATIEETLESLSRQTFKDFEVILVDDGSTDAASVEKLAGIEASSPWVTVIRKENGGVAQARNTGIENAKGRYVICLDADDVLTPTYIEKSTILLEANPDVAFVSTHKEMFGVINEVYENVPYNPGELIRNNMVITAAEFTKAAWSEVGGYKSGIGYEDWEYWINLSEHGYFGTLIPENLFRYRTAMQSRYVADKDAHWRTVKDIRALHPDYKKNIRKMISVKNGTKHMVEPGTALMNISRSDQYRQVNNKKPNVLAVLPWMTFGGAETLIVNFCNEIKDSFNLSFVTGLESKHEWEYKFKEISEDIYHLTNLFDNEDLYVEFVSNYIATRKIDAIHIIHTSFMFNMLPELKKRHPKLKVIVTVFNDRAEHFDNSVKMEQFIDAYTTDNSKVATHYQHEVQSVKSITVIPNGINSIDIFNPMLYDRKKEREQLGLAQDDVAVFFVGRLSEEKNPDVLLQAAGQIVTTDKRKGIKFFLIGDGGMRGEVEKMIAAINSSNVTYLGYQSEIARYLSAADIFVLPSSVEGFPLSILEAMAMKVAIVSSDVGAVSEIVDAGKDGFIVTPGSADEIKEAIVKLKDDPKLLESFKSQARQKVDEKYSNKILGQNYIKLYKGVIK